MAMNTTSARHPSAEPSSLFGLQTAERARRPAARHRVETSAFIKVAPLQSRGAYDYDRVLFQIDRHVVPTATALAWCALAALAKQHVRDMTSWAISLFALTAALVFSTAAVTSRATDRTRLRRDRAALAGAMATSALLVLVAASHGGLFVRLGIQCVVLELAAAALSCGCASSVAIRRGRSRGIGLGTDASPILYAAIAAAGGLAGHAALHVCCHGRAAAPHLLAFHFGGVVLATVAAAGFARGMTHRARQNL